MMDEDFEIGKVYLELTKEWIPVKGKTYSFTQKIQIVDEHGAVIQDWFDRGWIEALEICREFFPDFEIRNLNLQ